MHFQKLLKLKEKIVPVYQQLQEDTNLIYLWGTGALARNVYQYCETYGVILEGCFVDIRPVKEERFYELNVYSLAEVLKKNKKFSVIIEHSNYAEGEVLLKNLPLVENIYILSNICYKIWNPISSSFFVKNDDILNILHAELEDDLSKKCMLSYFESRANDEASYMYPYFKKGISYYKNDIFELSESEILLDIGAYTGGVIQSFISAVNHCYRAIIAIEPDEENFICLKDFVARNGIENVILKKMCAYSRDGYVKFSGDKEQGRVTPNNENVRIYPAMKIDSLCNEIPPEYADISVIKINFADSVPEIMDGAKKLLKENKPKLIIRIGFDENIFLETYKKIKKYNSSYKVYLRYTVGIPQGLTLFAI